MPQLDTFQSAERLKRLQCEGLRTMTERANDRLVSALTRLPETVNIPSFSGHRWLEEKILATRVKRSSDCGNSPKQRLLEDMTVAIGTADVKSVEKIGVPELCWIRVGKKPIEELDSVLETIRKTGAATEVEIERVVSHGRAGAVSGVLFQGGKRSAFCHMFEFNNTKATHIKSVTTYQVALR